nr:granulocyte-macrophage colony-stimulating factor receptor subunit alpha-like [Microcebus murinus]
MGDAGPPDAVTPGTGGPTTQDGLHQKHGREGTAAVNFSCLIYAVRFMNCSWAPGPAAPANVRYRLYSWDSADAEEKECVHYLTDSMGTRVGCHFDRLGEPKRTDNYFFLLNGTSKDGAVQFVDFTPFVAVNMERYDPPANLSASFDGSRLVIRWDNPETRFDLASHVLCYELDLQGKGGSPKKDPVFQRGQDRNVYVVPGSEARTESTVRVRVRHLRNRIWSEWSGALRFGHLGRDPPAARLAGTRGHPHGGGDDAVIFEWTSRDSGFGTTLHVCRLSFLCVVTLSECHKLCCQ